MNIAFVISASVLLVAAASMLVLPILRAGRINGQLRGTFGWIAAIALLLPASALVLYRLVGTPAALHPEVLVAQATTGQVGDTVAHWLAVARQHPDELQPWLRLASAATTEQRSDVALDAYGHALKIAPDHPEIMVAYVEAFAANDANHRLDAPARAVLERAVKRDPRQRQGLLLLGVADYQDGRFAEAADAWTRLLNVLPAGSKIAVTISRHIVDARARSVHTRAKSDNLPTPPQH